MIPDTVREIGAGAFAGCGALREVVIPDSVTDAWEGRPSRRMEEGGPHCVPYRSKTYIKPRLKHDLRRSQTVLRGLGDL